MLVKLARGQEAVTYGLEYLSTTNEALALAQALREHDLHQEALPIAEHGLTLHGNTYTLAHWLRDLASGLDKPELALPSARAAFTSMPTLAEYQAVQAIAGADWPQVRADLLKYLASKGYTPAKTAEIIWFHAGHSPSQRTSKSAPARRRASASSAVTNGSANRRASATYAAS